MHIHTLGVNSYVHAQIPTVFSARFHKQPLITCARVRRGPDPPHCQSFHAEACPKETRQEMGIHSTKAHWQIIVPLHPFRPWVAFLLLEIRL